MSSFLLLHQCPACLAHLIWMIFEMGGRCPYSCSFVGCCLQDLFNTARCILVQLPSRFLFIRLVKDNRKAVIKYGNILFCKREMDLPPEKRARVFLACKSENSRANVF